MLSSEIYSNTTTSTATAAVGTTATGSVATASTTTTTMEATTVKVVKPKKRRKRRKRAGHAITTTTTEKSATIPNPGSKPSSPRTQTGEPPSSASAVTSNGARKTKAPYFQHDNREYLARYESFRLTAHTWNYAAVARKFKPLRPALASGAKKTRRPAVSKRTHPDCACACQQKDLEPALEPAHRTAEHSIQKELPSSQTKINIDGSVLLELLKYSSSSLLETLLGAGSAVATSARDTHQIAEAQQQKNAKLREAFNISEYFVEGSSFDSDRKAKEDLAKSVALQKELDAQRESLAAAAAAGKDKETGKRYALVRTPSRERDRDGGEAAASGDERDHVSKTDKKKRKKRARESSASPERKKDKKKKSKKHKKESKSKKKKSRKRKHSESGRDSDRDSDDDDDSSDEDRRESKSARKKAKKDKY